MTDDFCSQETTPESLYAIPSYPKKDGLEFQSGPGEKPRSRGVSPAPLAPMRPQLAYDGKRLDGLEISRKDSTSDRLSLTGKSNLYGFQSDWVNSDPAARWSPLPCSGGAAERVVAIMLRHEAPCVTSFPQSPARKVIVLWPSADHEGRIHGIKFSR